MPPKAKFSKAEVLENAYRILLERGISGVTARALGEKLGTSSRPVFTAYESMEEIKIDLMKRALCEYRERVIKAEYYTLSYKQAAMEMIGFAMHEKHLFSFLFLENTAGNADNDGFRYGFTEKMIQRHTHALLNDYKIGASEAGWIMKAVLSQAFSVACRIALGLETMNEAAIQEMIGRELTAMVMLAKSGKTDFPYVPPVYRGKPKSPESES